MDRPKIDEKAKTINIKAKSNREFFLLHGYTGSPTDFNKLGEYLSKRFNSNVKIIRLKGHGERIENLSKFKYRDFFLQAEKELKKDIAGGKKIIIGGVSLGSFIALHLSTKYPVMGILSISNPYQYRIIPRIIAFFEPVILKKYWKKPIPSHEKELGKDSFYYDIDIRGVKVVKEAKKELEKILSNVKAPVLIIHTKADNVFHHNSSKIIKEKIASRIKQIYIFKKKASHNPFFAPGHEELYGVIGDFIEKNKLFR